MFHVVPLTLLKATVISSHACHQPLDVVVVVTDSELSVHPTVIPASRPPFNYALSNTNSIIRSRIIPGSHTCSAILPSSSVLLMAPIIVPTAINHLLALLQSLTVSACILSQFLTFSLNFFCSLVVVCIHTL